MTSPARCLVGLAVGYLVGSIPFAVLLARLLGNFDVTRDGTRNPGATNVFKHVGRVAGAAVGLLDYFKALVPALLADQWLGFSHAEATAVAVGAVLGHDFSFALRFRGGKGGASTLGVLSYLDFPALIGTGILWAVALPALKGRRFVAGLAALILFPVLTAVHVSPWGAAHLPAWGRVSGPLPVIVGAGLVALLWARVLPGLRREPEGTS